MLYPEGGGMCLARAVLMLFVLPQRARRDRARRTRQMGRLACTFLSSGTELSIK